MAEINQIVAKEAIEGIRNADTALVAFDATMNKTLTALTQFTVELKKQGITYKELAAISKAMADEKKRSTETEKQAAKIVREAEKADKARIAALEKLAAKEKAHTEALKLEVKTVNDAIRQNKALIAERNQAATSLGKQSKEVQALNAKMQQNTEFIRQNGTAMEKQRMNIGNYSSALKGIGSSLLSLAGIGTGIAAIGAFAKSAFSAFEQQEQANRKLLFSLKGSKVAFKELTAQANDFQSRTGIADDAIQGIQVLGAEAGKSVADIKKITEATINWSKVTGQDLQSAYLQINATLTGTAGRLTRVDGDFGKLTKTQLEAGAAIDLINTKYAGFAENAATETEKLSANWDEFKESAGGAIGGVINPLLKETSSLLNDINTKQGFWQKTFTLLASTMPQLAGLSATFDARNAAKNSDKGIDYDAIRNAQSTKDLVARAVAERLAASAAITVEENKKKAAEVFTGTVTKQIGAYEKLTQSINDSKEQINNLLALGQTPSTALIDKLKADEQKLKDIANAAAVAVNGLASYMQIYESVDIPDNTDFSIAKDSSPISVDPMAVPDRMFAEGELSQFAIDQAQVVADTTFQIMADSSMAEFDLKMSLLEKEKEAKLSNTKLTEAQRAKIEADYQKKSAKLKTEQFKKDKAAAVIQSIISGVLAVLKAGGLTTPTGIAAAISATAQTAIIASQKIPQFDTGKDSTPSTFIAGERRPEWMIEPSGRVRLVTKPTLFKNMAGATVIGGEQTQQMLNAGVSPVDLRPDIAAMKADIVNAIKSKRELHISASGSKITERQGEYYKNYFNRKVAWAGKRN